jgi:transketolase
MHANLHEIIDELKDTAIKARAAILSMTTLAGSGHPGGSMSAIDILLALYKVIRHDPKQPLWEDRDRVVVSNGHISPAVYSCLALSGYFSIEDAVSQFRKAGSIFEGHIEREVPGVEWSSGNLGQGLSAGTGMALRAKLRANNSRVYVLMGDGEQQKGQISEARRFAIKYGLSNLCAIVDHNRIQISGAIGDVMPQNIAAEWEAAGWNVLTIDGHDYQAIFQALESIAESTRPSVILAETVMGKGVPFMENQARYHGSTLSETQLEQALEILEVPNHLSHYRKLREQFKPSNGHADNAAFCFKPDIKPGLPVLYEADTDNRSAWGNAIAGLEKANASSDTPIVVLDCDLASSVKTSDFAALAPDRFFQCGIMEHNTAVLGGALSTCGFQTFWADFGMFGLGEVYNMQRLNDINHTHLKVVLTHVGLDVGEDGKTHQSIDYIGLTRNLFNFRLICPADPNQTDRVIRWVATKPGNYIITMGRSKLPILKTEDGEPIYKKDYNFQYGNPDILRIGNHGTLFVTGTPAARALKAVDMLRDEGIYLQLVYISCPLEIPLGILAEASNNGLIFTVEDHSIRSGLGSIIADRLMEEGLGGKLVKMGVDRYPQSGTSDDLFRLFKLDHQSIAETIKHSLAKN